MAWQTDYCIMKEGMSILRGRKSVPGTNSNEREMEKGYYFAFTNKADLDTMSMGDLYNNLNVYELEDKGMSSSSSSTQNMDFVSSSNNNTSSTNGAVNTAQVVNTAHGVSTNTQVNGAYSTNIALVSCDALGGYDWTDQAEKGPNYALMSFASLSFVSEIVNNCKKGLGYENYKAVLPPYIRNFMPPTPDLSFTGLGKFVNKPIVENCKAKSSEEEPKTSRNSPNTSYPTSPEMAYRHIFRHYKYKTLNSVLGLACLGLRKKSRLSLGMNEPNGILGKFDGKVDECFFVGYSLNSKSFRVFNSRTRIVEENLHIRFSESTPNVVGSGPDWLFVIDALTRTMNYEAIVEDPKSSHDDGSKPSCDDGKKVDEDPRKESKCIHQEKEDNVNSTNNVNTADVSIFNFSSDDEDDGTVADMNNLDTTIQVIPIPTIRIHKDNLLDQVIGDLKSATQTRKMSKNLGEHGFGSTVTCPVDGKEIIITESSIRRDLQLADEEDEAVHKELGDRLVRAATTASSLRVEQDGGGHPRCQENMRDTTAQTRFESVSKYSNDLLLTKTTQKKKIASLKRRVKKLKKRNRSRTHKLKKLYKVGFSAKVESSDDEEILGEDASKQGRRINVIDVDEDIALVNDADKEMFNVDDLGGEEVFVIGQNENVVEEVVNVAQVNTVAITDKGKGIMIEEPVKPKKKDQIRLDEEAAEKLQAEFDEEERLAKEQVKKEERANISLIET
nr:ribonuclease H-like domain-containing protein [Tanacetum cinerariifolium]